MIPKTPLVSLALLAQLAVPGSLAHGSGSPTPRSETRLVPFGERLVVDTAVLRATAIVLSEDERLRSLTQPDSERWQVDFSEYGPDGATVPVVTVTPTDCGISTNLVVLTTRRVYAIVLASQPCDLASGLNPSPPFDAVVRFRYPEEETTRSVAQPPAPAPAEAVSLAAPLRDLLDEASRFTWEPHHGYRGPRPRLVTSDGASTFLVFPEASFRGRDLPLLFLVNEQGERELANFDVEGTTLVVRTTFQEAVLLAGGKAGRRQPHLVIRRRS